MLHMLTMSTLMLVKYSVTTEQDMLCRRYQHDQHCKFLPHAVRIAVFVSLSQFFAED